MSIRSPGKLPGYETTFVTRPELSDDNLKILRDRLTAVITEAQGEIVLTEDWGKRKLAYPIQKETRGQYTYIVYTGKGDLVHEIERNLRLHEHVLRFLTVNLEKEFDGEAFKKLRTEIQAAAKRREEEREARREERYAARHHDDRHEYRDYREEATPRAAEAEVAGREEE